MLHGVGIRRNCAFARLAATSATERIGLRLDFSGAAEGYFLLAAPREVLAANFLDIEKSDLTLTIWRFKK